MDPIRIKFCENVDHFVEAQEQLPPTAPLISEKNQKIFFGLLIGGTLAVCLAGQYQQGASVGCLLFILVCFLLVMAFWFWFFKKIGLYKTGPPKPYQWTEKDRARFQQTYLKQTGRTETQVVCEFNGQGFSLGPENEKPGVHEWAAIVKVVECPKGLLIFIPKSGYFWFPSRAFASPASYQELLKLVTEKVPEFQRLDLAIIALGSNLGDSAKILGDAMTRLQSLSNRQILKSSLWRTMPVDCPPDSPEFVNAVVGLVPLKHETPESLLKKLQALQTKFGRTTKKILNEPRPLDLDLIAFGNETRQTPELILPHPRAHQRRFVLQPLSEITPDLILPGQGKTVSELLAGLPPDDITAL